MKTSFEMKIHQGLGELYFGMPVEEAINYLGPASELEELDSLEDMHTTVLHYSDLGIVLFFEENEPKLKCIDVKNQDLLFAGERFFQKREKDIVELMIKEGYYEQDIEIEPWGEKRISFYDANVDFFFEESSLVSVVFGK